MSVLLKKKLIWILFFLYNSFLERKINFNARLFSHIFQLREEMTILGFHSIYRRVSSVRDEKSARRRPRATSAQFRVIPPRLRGGDGGLLLVFVRVLIPLRSIYIYIYLYTYIYIHASRDDSVLFSRHWAELMTTPGKRTFARITYPIFVSVVLWMSMWVYAVPPLTTLRSLGRNLL